MQDAKRQKMDTLDWNDIGKAFRSDGSRAMCEKMYYIMHGVFERDLQWAEKMENKVMKIHGIAYNSPPPEQKFGSKKVSSGIEVIIKQQRCECNKLINMRTQKSHKKKIIIVEFVDYNNFPGKKRVRKKDTFYNDFITGWPGWKSVLGLHQPIILPKQVSILNSIKKENDSGSTIKVPSNKNEKVIVTLSNLQFKNSKKDSLS